MISDTGEWEENILGFGMDVCIRGMYVCMHVCMYGRCHAYIANVFVYVHVYVYVYVYLYACTYIGMNGVDRQCVGNGWMDRGFAMRDKWQKNE